MVTYYIEKLRAGYGPVILIVFLVLSQKGIAQPDSVLQLNNVTVKGTFIHKVQTIIPSQTIHATDFKKYTAYNMADAIRHFSGVNIKDYGGIGGLKTVSVRSLGANHTAVQYDGVPITDWQNGQIDLGKINLDNVHSVTLFNGQPADICIPARSLASASLLMINSAIPRLDSLRPTKIKVSLTSGSFGLVHPVVQLQQRLSERWALRLTSNYQQAHGRYRFRVQGDGSDSLVNRTNAALSVIQQDAAFYWRKSDSTYLNIRVNYYHSDRGLPGAVVFYNPFTNQHLWNRDFFVQSSYRNKWKNWRLHFNGKYTLNYTRYLDPDYLNSAGKLDQRYYQQDYYTSASIAWNYSPVIEVAYASDVSLSTLHTSMYGFAYPQRWMWLNAISARMHLPKFDLQGTLLHTWMQDKVKLGTPAADKSIWSPSIMATYQPLSTSEFQIRAFYKNIFRSPTFNDLYYSRSGNRSLLPEWATQYNLGITWHKEFSKKVQYLDFTTDVYYNYVKDKIIAVPNKDLFSWTILNLGEVDIRGIDLALKTQVHVPWNTEASAAVNYTFQEALDITDKNSSAYLNQIPYTPRHTLSINAGLDHDKWSVFFNQSWTSHRYYLSENLPEHYVAGFFVTDLSGQYRFNIAGKSLSTSLEINNLLNAEYAFIRSFPMPGRSYRFSIQISI